MTGAQASDLKTLSEQAHKPEAYAPKSKWIDALKQAIKDRDG